MKHWPFYIALLFAVASPSALWGSDFKWPQGQRAAISLSYDDALNSQLDHAVPMLNKHDVKASFYLLLASPVVNERMDEWRAVAAAGHELGNHTLFHPCSASAPNRDWVSPHNDLDKRSVEQMVQEVHTANSFLKAIDGRSERTMTPPCLEAKAGDGDYLAAVQDQFVAIKGVEQNLPANFTSFLLPDGQSGKQLIAYVKQAARKGGIANIIFHGVGGDHLAVSSKAHQELIEFLAKNRDQYWTDTYLNIMRHVNSRLPAVENDVPSK